MSRRGEDYKSYVVTLSLRSLISSRRRIYRDPKQGGQNYENNE